MMFQHQRSFAYFDAAQEELSLRLRGCTPGISTDAPRCRHWRVAFRYVSRLKWRFVGTEALLMLRPPQEERCPLSHLHLSHLFEAEGLLKLAAADRLKVSRLVPMLIDSVSARCRTRVGPPDSRCTLVGLKPLSNMMRISSQLRFSLPLTTVHVVFLTGLPQIPAIFSSSAKASCSFFLTILQTAQVYLPLPISPNDG